MVQNIQKKSKKKPKKKHVRSLEWDCKKVCLHKNLLEIIVPKTLKLTNIVRFLMKYIFISIFHKLALDEQLKASIFRENKKRYDSELPYQRPDLIEVMEIEHQQMFILVSI